MDLLDFKLVVVSAPLARPGSPVEFLSTVVLRQDHPVLLTVLDQVFPPDSLFLLNYFLSVVLHTLGGQLLDGQAWLWRLGLGHANHAVAVIALLLLLAVVALIVILFE